MSDVSFEQFGPWFTVRFHTHTLTDPVKIGMLRSSLEGAIKDLPGKPQVLMSFKGVDAVSSQVIGLMLGVKAQVGARAGSLVLTNLGKNVETVLKLTRLEKQFDIRPSASQVLAPHLPQKPAQATKKGEGIDWMN